MQSGRGARHGSSAWPSGTFRPHAPRGVSARHAEACATRLSVLRYPQGRSRRLPMFGKRVCVGRLLLSVVASTAPLLLADDDQAKNAPRDNSGAVKVSHPRRVRLGGISFGASYSHFSGPYWGWPYSCGPYGYRPLFWNAYGPASPP